MSADSENEQSEADDFEHLKAHIPDWKLDELGLSKSDRHILGTIDLLEQKVDVLSREFNQLQKRLLPISRLYEKMSSFWAVVIYVMGGLFAVIEMIKTLKEFAL